MLARQHVLLAVLLAGGAHSTSAKSPPRARQHPMHEHYARQINDQLASSSSYDYWWPYPPAGQPTPTPAPTLVDATPTANDVVLSTTPYLAVSLDSFASSPVPSSSAASPSPSSASESIPMSAVSTISALPPSNTTSAYHSPQKLSMVSNNNLIYIVTGCGVAGLLIGGIMAWCIYGCVTRRKGQNRQGESAVLRRRRKSYGTLEVGPEYRPPTPGFDEKEEEDDDEGEWLGKEGDLDDADKFERAAEDDDDEDLETHAFLHPENARNQTENASPARHKSIVSSRGPSPAPSGRTSLFFDRPDSSDGVPWESLRHKSIKRGILERLREDGEQDPIEHERVSRRPWQAHGRHDSDVFLSDAQADLSRMSSRVTTATSAALSRASSSVTAGIGMGFRIMSESPAATPQGEHNADVFRWPSSKKDTDKFTPAPTRVAHTRSQSSERRAASPDKLQRARSPPAHRRRGRGGRRTRDNSMADVEESGVSASEIRRVLPQSPPRVSSPVLDEVLCFTPMVADNEQMTSFASFGQRM
ncbi:hypothetical protein MKEN_00415500 [Mycena kentingensis (nom. inval.)]|nr:hypothetical protein MKEN_00415500 [Mycena kentingensis (nom. inval.)]